MSKLFKVGGVSKSKSGYKVRFANDMTRVKILTKTDSDINLVELPHEMSRSELVTFLKGSDLYQNTEYRMAIDTADAKYNGVGVFATKDAKIQAKPSLDAIRARIPAKDAVAE